MIPTTHPVPETVRGPLFPAAAAAPAATGPPRLGLALRRLTVHAGDQDDLEPYLVTYLGSRASVRTAAPLMAVTRAVGIVRLGEPARFAGPGLVALAPVEIGALAVWQVEIWAGRRGHRRFGAALSAAGRDRAATLVLALLGGHAGLAARALARLARGLGELLERRGDHHLLTWAGSIRAGRLAAAAGREHSAGNRRAEAAFTVLVEPG